jgi:hypothetical protein
MAGLRIVDVTQENIEEHGFGCVVNPKHIGYRPKLEWARKRFAEGLRIKLLKEGGSAKGIFEYIPGEFAWRAVKADGYFFIHCLWIYSNDLRHQGYGFRLVQESVRDAEESGKLGVAVASSSGPWMTDKRVFLQNGFKQVAQADRFELLIHQLRPGPLPRFRDWQEPLGSLKGWHLLYTNQCPMLAKSVHDLREAALELGLALKIRELATAREVQNGPSLYGTFCLVRDGRLLADHYISRRRFLNIVNKESDKLR